MTPRLTRATLACATAVVAILAATGCGSDDPHGTTGIAQTATAPQQLTPAELRVVERTQQEVIAYCRHVARVVRTPGRTPDPARFARVNAAIDELATLAAENPEAETADGISARLALGDIAENLEGTNCDNRLVERIDQRLAGL